MTWEAIYDALSQPFDVKDIEWRAGSTSRDKKRAQALPYADVRCYETRLDEVLGPNWSCGFTTWGEQRIICEVTLTVDGQGITRSSTGEFDSGDKIAQGTTAEAQAFKRACSRFGLGRFIYSIPVQWVGYDEQTRKLTETPQLPRQLQQARAAANSTRTPTQPAPAQQEPKLTAQRAEAMSREMEKLGLSKREQLTFAGRILKHDVVSFEDLSEPDALNVWNEARKQPKRASV